MQKRVLVFFALYLVHQGASLISDPNEKINIFVCSTLIKVCLQLNICGVIWNKTVLKLRKPKYKEFNRFLLILTRSESLSQKVPKMSAYGLILFWNWKLENQKSISCKAVCTFETWHVKLCPSFLGKTQLKFTCGQDSTLYLDI